MKQVYRYGSNGKYIEPVILNDGEVIPNDCTDKQLPQPNYKPFFINGKWVETITQEELDEILSKIPVKSEIETLQDRVALSEAAIDFLIMNGGL